LPATATVGHLVTPDEVAKMASPAPPVAHFGQAPAAQRAPAGGTSPGLMAGVLAVVILALAMIGAPLLYRAVRRPPRRATVRRQVVPAYGDPEAPAYDDLRPPSYGDRHGDRESPAYGRREPPRYGGYEAREPW
jgi:hypothetical protein